jgi:hypothetical protein
MTLRIFLAFVLGTVANLAIFGVIATANGTPVPSWRSPHALLMYPTDSVAGTVVLAWVVYFLFLVITCVIFPKRNSSAR